MRINRSKFIQPLTAIDSGLFAAIMAFLIWGVFPVYFKLTEVVSPLEVLCHRIVWAAPFATLIILFRRQWAEIWAILNNKTALYFLVITSLLMAGNWGLYIWAIQQDEIIQTSLGYYINPLMNMGIGVFFFKETLYKTQKYAIFLAVIGVAILTFYGGVFPWIALVLATSFCLYGVLRKKVEAGAMPGLFIETLLLFPFGLLILIYLYNSGQMEFFSHGISMTGWLVFAGPMTVIPLFFFAIAAKKINFSTLGFLQFIAPTLQFCFGLYYGEPFSLAHALCFSCIWGAVGLYIFGSLKKPKSAH